MASVQPLKRRSSTSRHGPGRQRAGDGELAAHVRDLLDRVCHLALRRSVAGPLQRLLVGQPERRREPAREVGHQRPAAPRRDRGDPGDGRAPAAHRLGRGVDQLVVEAPGAAPGLHERVPAAVAEPRERAALLGPHVLGDLAHRAVLGRRHLLDLEQHRLGAQVQRGARAPAPGPAAPSKRAPAHTEQRPQSAGSGSSSSSCSARMRQRPSAPNAAIAVCSSRRSAVTAA